MDQPYRARCGLTILHVISAVTCGVFALWTLVYSLSDLVCMPLSTDFARWQFDGPFSLCHVLLYVTLATSAWSLVSVSCVSCCHPGTKVLALQMVLCAAVGLLYVAGATLLTLDFVAWCDQFSCDSQTSQCGSDCLDSAKLMSNSTVNYVRQFWECVVEMACFWTTVPTQVLLTVVYIRVLWLRRVRRARVNLDEEHRVDPPVPSPPSPQNPGIVAQESMDEGLVRLASVTETSTVNNFELGSHTQDGYSQSSERSPLIGGRPSRGSKRGPVSKATTYCDPGSRTCYYSADG